MNSSKPYFFKRIFKYYGPHWIPITGFLILNLLATPIALLKPFALKFLIDSGFGSEPIPKIIKFFFPADYHFHFNTIAIIAAVLVIIIAIIDNVYAFLVWVLGTIVGEKLVLNLRTLLFNHIQRMSLAYHDRKGASDSLYRIQWDTMSIRTLVFGQFSPIISSVVTLFAMTTVMFIINWHFGIIALCVIPPLYILTRLSTKKLRKDWHNTKEAESSAMSIIHEVLSSLRVVKAFGQEENEGNRFSIKANEAVKSQLRMSKTSATFSFIVGIVLALGTAAFIYLGATDVHLQKMTLGELTLVIAYLTQIFGPLQTIIKNLNEVQSSIVSIDRVFSVLDQEKEVVEIKNPLILHRAKGNFEFKNVYFGYQKDKPTLTDIAFKINIGDRVGIMGSTGAGKSTLISLLNRFYDPTSGSITIDGCDIKKFRLKDFRNQFSIVLQEPVLFSTTIAENIRYGRPKASEEDIIEAAKAANAHDFTMHCKDGYQTMVGERGMHLSGGERQRLSIARAFIKNAPILILDEPTSSLDIKAEALIMEAMERLMLGRTTFMITHRLDTLKSCNVLIHLEKGRLVEVISNNSRETLAATKEKYLTVK